MLSDDLSIRDAYIARVNDIHMFSSRYSWRQGQLLPIMPPNIALHTQYFVADDISVVIVVTDPFFAKLSFFELIYAVCCKIR